jgi:hypothetical protein
MHDRTAGDPTMNTSDPDPITTELTPINEDSELPSRRGRAGPRRAWRSRCSAARTGYPSMPTPPPRKQAGGRSGSDAGILRASAREGMARSN